jgi:transcriptional regulator with XRE-family HTH domain
MPNYASQRERKTPPHISLGDLRAVSGKTLDQICDAVSEVTSKPFTRGALSAIENGHRGASQQVLTALEVAYGLRPGALTTNYLPRNREDVSA